MMRHARAGRRCGRCGRQAQWPPSTSRTPPSGDHSRARASLLRGWRTCQRAGREPVLQAPPARAAAGARSNRRRSHPRAGPSRPARGVTRRAPASTSRERPRRGEARARHGARAQPGDALEVEAVGRAREQRTPSRSRAPELALEGRWRARWSGATGGTRRGRPGRTEGSRGRRPRARGTAGVGAASPALRRPHAATAPSAPAGEREGIARDAAHRRAASARRGPQEAGRPALRRAPGAAVRRSRPGGASGSAQLGRPTAPSVPVGGPGASPGGRRAAAAQPRRPEARGLRGRQQLAQRRRQRPERPARRSLLALLASRRPTRRRAWRAGCPSDGGRGAERLAQQAGAACATTTRRSGARLLPATSGPAAPRASRTTDTVGCVSRSAGSAGRCRSAQALGMPHQRGELAKARLAARPGLEQPCRQVRPTGVPHARLVAPARDCTAGRGTTSVRHPPRSRPAAPRRAPRSTRRPPGLVAGVHDATPRPAAGSRRPASGQTRRARRRPASDSGADTAACARAETVE
jgi:hypothetical protein